MSLVIGVVGGRFQHLILRYLTPIKLLGLFPVFIPYNFLCIKWNKKIEVTHDNEASNVNEDRRLNLYNPFKIKTFYGLNAPDKMVGDETHEFYRKVIRVKFLWWNDYRIVSTWNEDTTEFDRALDNYLTGGNC